MAKKKSNGPGLLDFAVAARQALRGDATISPLESIKSYISGGIQMPLAMQYFLDIRAYPLGIIVQLTGEHGSRKTTTLFEFASWFNELSGATDFTLTEGKLSESLIYATNGYPDEIVDEHGNIMPYPVNVRISENSNGWQRDITQQVDMFNDMMDKGWNAPDGTKMPSGIYAPMFFGVDSVVAQLTEEQTTQVEKDGGQDRGYATHVKALSQWISAIQQKITCRPYTMVLINHCTVDRPTEYQVIINPKGGRKLAYESSIIIFLSRKKMVTVKCDKPNHTIEAKVTYVTFKLLKSSVGDDTKQIVVPILDENEIMGGGDVRQRTTYLWGEALVDILESKCYSDTNEVKLDSVQQQKALRDRYKSVFTAVVPFERLNGKMWKCSKYSDDVMDAQTFGTHLENDPEFRSVFYEQTGIKPYEVWTPGTNYATFIADVKNKQYADRARVQ